MGISVPVDFITDHSKVIITMCQVNPCPSRQERSIVCTNLRDLGHTQITSREFHFSMPVKSLGYFLLSLALGSVLTW